MVAVGGVLRALTRSADVWAVVWLPTVPAVVLYFVVGELRFRRRLRRIATGDFGETGWAAGTRHRGLTS